LTDGREFDMTKWLNDNALWDSLDEGQRQLGAFPRGRGEVIETLTAVLADLVSLA
jgi:hypothetical protein